MAKESEFLKRSPAAKTKSASAREKAAGPSRRALLKAGGALLGSAAGAGALTGFPTIWAQEIKDIELRHVGVSYSVVKAIGDQASKDLGFKVTMQNLDTTAAINRFITQPDSVDIADVEGWQSKLATKRGILQGIEVKKIKEFDNILPIFTKGELEGHKIPRQGISPYEAMYIDKPSATELHEGVTDYMTFLPQVYNADSIGYRPDLLGHEVTEWKELLDPKFKGKAAILDVPAIGIMDAALCFESAGLITYGNKGNMTKKEIDFTADKLIELKKSGHFRATWTTFDQSVQLMALSGWQGAFVSRYGYYSPVPSTAKKFMTETEWAYWYEARAGADQRSLRRVHGTGRHGARRRLVRQTRDQHRLLEHADGRSGLHEQALERLQGGVTRAGRFSSGPARFLLRSCNPIDDCEEATSWPHATAP
jgi:spermidine/putrescine-binding protein